jgi:hypothetical protein
VAGALTGLLAAGGVALSIPSTATAAPTTLHVATSGSDGASGSSSAPLRTVQRAVDLAGPGSTILVHAGTYAGQVKIRKSGTATARITLAAAGDGVATLTSSPTRASCGSRQPAASRTIMVGDGADNWTIRGLNIVNGIHIFGKNGNAAYSWFTTYVKAGLYAPRRAVPGRGTNDAAAARNAASYLSAKTGQAIDPSDGLQITGNTITGRGIHAAMSRYGTISGNHIYNIDCGTGPAIWLITFSDGWTISANNIHDVAPSTAAHFMQEGIRLGSASNYNKVTGNTVTDLPGDGRAYNTDVDSSWNTFEGNIARRVAIGYNDQMSGWGNQWIRNTVESYRTYGFGFRLKDGSLSRPSLHSSAYKAVVKCNVATGVSGHDLGIGGIKSSTFTGNSFSPIMLSRNAQAYWGAEGNRWNGSASAPSPTAKYTNAGC